MKKISGYGNKYFADAEKGIIYGLDMNELTVRLHTGIATVKLYYKGKRHDVSVARLILKTFKPIENDELYNAIHINGNKFDNRLDNLEWRPKRKKTVKLNGVIMTARSAATMLSTFEDMNFQYCYKKIQKLNGANPECSFKGVHKVELVLD